MTDIPVDVFEIKRHRTLEFLSVVYLIQIESQLDF